MEGKSSHELIRWRRIATLVVVVAALIVGAVLVFRARTPTPAPAPAARTTANDLPRELEATPLVPRAGRPVGREEAADGEQGGELMRNELPRVVVPDSDLGERSGERTPRLRSGRRVPRYFPDGTLAPAVVATEIDRRKGAIVSAYEHALRRNPDLSGVVEVRFRIGASGRPSHIRVVRDTLRDPSVTERIKEIMPTWSFPTPAHGEHVYSYPFVFKRG